MTSQLETFVQSLQRHSRLTDQESDAALALTGRPEQLVPGQNFVMLGDDTTACCLVLNGFCGRVGMPTDETRQFTAIYVPGNMPDLYSAFVPEATSTLEALTPATILRVSHSEIHRLMREFPAITEALSRHLIYDASITIQWLSNVAGRDAKNSVAHLLCEMAMRLDDVTKNDFSYYFPLSQQLLSQACGISTVHMNRSLMALRRLGTVAVHRGMVHVLDWRKLKAVARFDDRYLVSQAQNRFLSEAWLSDALKGAPITCDRAEAFGLS